ncbi:MAG: hypothetical protein SNJ64_01100 [Endomicrobiia bacterium]
MAVINIITKNADDINGFHANITYGQMTKTFARRNINLSYGKVVNDDFNFTTSLFLGQGNRSDREYTDLNNDSYDMTDNTQLNPMNVNINLNYKNFSSRIIVDQYKVSYKNETSNLLDSVVTMFWNSYFFDMNYNYKINDKLTFTPQFKYKQQSPWKTPKATTFVIRNPNNTNYVYDTVAERYTGNFMLNYDPTEKTNIIAGIELYNDKAVNNIPGRSTLGGQKEVYYHNIASYVQGLFDIKIAKLTIGGRYDNHSVYKPSFVSRIGITKVFEKLHFKLLQNGSFRAPSIENIGLNKNVLPEETTTTEFETGYQFSKKAFLRTNLFNTTIENPIVYFYNPSTGDESYLNYGNIKTRGAEVEFDIKDCWGSTKLNYSYYTVVENKVSRYAVPDKNDILLGFANHKITLNSSINVSKKFIMNPSVIYFSERYGYYIYDINGNPVIKKFEPITLVNLYFNYKDMLWNNFDLGFGVYDIFDSKYEFIQPYDGNHSPLPGPSREVVVKVSYRY